MVRKKDEEQEITSEDKPKAKPAPALDLWNRIKDLPIDMFSLPNQEVNQYCKPDLKLIEAYPNDLYMKIKCAMVKPALEEALGRVRLGKDMFGRKLIFELSEVGQYTVVKVIPIQ